MVMMKDTVGMADMCEEMSVVLPLLCDVMELLLARGKYLKKRSGFQGNLSRSISS